MTYDRRKRKNERGVALLFALGILAMLLMVGLGFVTNAVISQRIAANNSTRAQARVFARAAAARAMAAVLLYCDQAAGDNPAPANNFERTISSFNALRSSGSVAFRTDGAETNGELTDQLTGTNSKLNYTYDSEIADYRFRGEDANASWTFFYDDAGDGDKKIVGRAAWTVLPRHAWVDSNTQRIGDQSRISLYAVLGGASNGDGIAPNYTGALKNDRDVVPWLRRWGRDIDELYMENSTVFNQWQDKNGAIDRPPYTFDILFSAYREFFGTSSSTPTVNVRKAWTRKWFSEGYMRLAKEAYAYLDNSHPVYLHRFNVGDYATSSSPNEDTEWYARFAGTTEKNMGEGSDSVLEKLAAPSRPWRERDVNDNLFADTDKWGLPFLTRIGNDPWSFENITNFRKQIAANFNDYCDDDSIPTSNIANSEWNVNDEAKFPSYTGNEKTDYINEIALGFTIPLAAGTSAEVTGTNKFSGQKIEPQLIASNKPKQDIVVETVRVYDTDGEDAAVSYTATGGIKKTNIDITSDLKYTIVINYQDDGGNEQSPSVNVTVQNVKARLAISDAGTGNSSTSAALLARTAGYRIGTIAQTRDMTMTWTGMTDVASQLDEACKSETGPHNYTVTSVTVTMNVKEFACEDLQLTPMMLTCGSDNVDFVRWDKAGKNTDGSDSVGPMLEVETLTLSGTAPGTAPISLDLASGDELKFFIVGFEAKDPRQNLFPMTSKWSGRTEVRSDWTLAPKFAVANSDALTSETMAPTMTFTGSTFSAGKVNTESNPGAPAGFSSGEYDVEAVTDPAWSSGDAQISTAHIRNQPMKSLWEIGMIHRARPWQTLNLTGAAGFTARGTERKIDITDMAPNKFATVTNALNNLGTPKWDEAEGTSYSGGDGGILEMVKLTQNSRSFGKVDINLFRNSSVPGESTVFTNIGTLNNDIIKALFLNIRGGQTMYDFIKASTAASDTKGSRTPIAATSGTMLSNDTNGVTVTDTVASSFTDAANNLTDTAADPSLLRSKFLNTDYGKNGSDPEATYTFNLAASDDNAGQEEIIGKTINLLGAGGTSIPNIFQVLIVAQSINDIGGTAGSPVAITKVDADGENQEIQCELGVFNYKPHATDHRKNLYFDEITGETKLVATIERDPETGQMVIRQLEYVE